MGNVVFKIFGILIMIVHVNFAHCDCEENKLKINEIKKELNINNMELNVYVIDSIFNSTGNCFSAFQKSSCYNELAEKIYQINPYSDQIYLLEKKAILNGYCNAVLLEYSQCQWLKKICPLEYNDLEKISDSVFISKYPNANLELAFTLRFMVRHDQRIRIEHRNTPQNDSIKIDSLMSEMRKIDELNQQILSLIFRQYTYPGYSIVGCEHNAGSLIFQHMGVEFQVENIVLLDNAVNSKELYEDLKPLIDKVLFKKFNVTIYGTHYSNRKPETDLTIINKYRNLLNLKPIQ
jgi:hypothetical protein